MKIIKNLFYKKYQDQITIKSPNGLHLRPVAKFVSFAKKFKCDIYIKVNDDIKNAKDINSILQLSLKYNDTFELITQGSKAKESLKHLKKEFKDILAKDTSQTISIHHQKIPTNRYPSKGININSIYEGIVIAPIYNCKISYKQNTTDITLQDAIEQSIQKLSNIQDDIFEAQKELLKSIDTSIDTIENLKNYISTQISQLPPNLKSKAIDYQDIQTLILQHMGMTQQLILPKEPSILICDDLLPSQIKNIQHSNIVGVILKKAFTNSHSAILLKNSGIVSAICDNEFTNNSILLLDTTISTAIINPSQEDIQIANTYIKQEDIKHQQALDNKNKEVFTKDGKKITILANISDIDSAKDAKENSAEGVGLLRSEFMFTQKAPSLDEQTDIYKQIFELFEHITVRTLDVGGDKELPYIHIEKEQNPFLGIRGVRLLKIIPDILESQLLAIYRASKSKSIKVMFPMITTTDEFKEAKEFALNVAKKYNIDISHIEFGMMIETPLVLFNLDKFNKLVDFYSIGSNDLAQYSFAIQRGHHTLRYDETHPEFLNILSHIIKNANKPLSLCGELASNKQAIHKLIDMGLDTFSISPANIPTIKEEIRDV